MAQKVPYSKKIDNFCSAYATYVLKAFGKSQPLIWPIPMNETYWYICKYFLRELYKDIKRLKDKDVAIERIEELFVAPTRISMFLAMIYGMSFSDLKIKEKVELTELLLDLLPRYRREDLFCENGSNIIWTKQQASKELKKCKMINLDENKNAGQLAKILGKINATLWLYCEFIHGAFHSYGYEFHGPYSLNNKEKLLIVREYYDIKPSLVWPFASRLPFDKVTTFEVYKDCKINFDLFGHLETTVSLPQHLQSFHIKTSSEGIESEVNNLSGLDSILSNCAETLNEALKFTSNFNKYDWAKKIVEMHYHYLVPHKDLLKQDWKPSDSIYLAINKGSDEIEMANTFKSFEKIWGMSKKESFNLIKDFLLNSIYK